jgi:ABC-type nitrate/sulfonate/bicarbonate transport system permease component
MSLVYVYLVFLGAAGFLIDMAFIRCQRWVCPWYEQ